MQAEIRYWLVPFLGGLGVGIILAWNVEAFAVGRGPVSSYLGPIGPFAVLAALGLQWLAHRSAR